MSDTAVADLTNPSQGTPPLPNEQRTPPPAADETKTPEQIAAEAAAAAENKTPTEQANIGGDPVDDRLVAPTSADAVDGVIAYPKTGDVGMDMALEFIGKLGIGGDHPAMQATFTNDFGPIKALLASLGDKAVGYEQFVALAEAANTKANEARAARREAIGKSVAGVLGDAQADILAWASKNATPDEKRSINAMLAADPVQARAAANMLLGAYQKAAGTVVTPASAARDAGGDPPRASNTRLTNKEFAKESMKLANRVGSHNLQNHPEYIALTRRLG